MSDSVSFQQLDSVKRQCKEVKDQLEESQQNVADCYCGKNFIVDFNCRGRNLKNTKWSAADVKRVVLQAPSYLCL